jgi:hypothetical protein
MRWVVVRSLMISGCLRAVVTLSRQTCALPLLSGMQPTNIPDAAFLRAWLQIWKPPVLAVKLQPQTLMDLVKLIFFEMHSAFPPPDPSTIDGTYEDAFATVCCLLGVHIGHSC